MIRTRRMMGGKCSTYGVKERCISGFRCGDPSEGDHLENRGKEGRIILKWILNMWVGKVWNGLLWTRRGKGDSSCESDNETLGLIKYGEFLDYLRTY
jgi:hypothetical protein